MGDERTEDFRAERRRSLGLLADYPRARNTDPETSHQAAQAIKDSGQLGRQQREALEAVRRWPGSTTAELGVHMSRETGQHWEAFRHAYGRRLSDLTPVYVTAGSARRCTVTGRLATSWEPK